MLRGRSLEMGLCEAPLQHAKRGCCLCIMSRDCCIQWLAPHGMWLPQELSRVGYFFSGLCGRDMLPCACASKGFVPVLY